METLTRAIDTRRREDIGENFEFVAPVFTKPKLSSCTIGFDLPDRLRDVDLDTLMIKEVYTSFFNDPQLASVQSLIEAFGDIAPKNDVWQMIEPSINFHNQTIFDLWAIFINANELINSEYFSEKKEKCKDLKLKYENFRWVLYSKVDCFDSPCVQYPIYLSKLDLIRNINPKLFCAIQNCILNLIHAGVFYIHDINWYGDRLNTDLDELTDEEEKQEIINEIEKFDNSLSVVYGSCCDLFIKYFPFHPSESSITDSHIKKAIESIILVAAKIESKRENLAQVQYYNNNELAFCFPVLWNGDDRFDEEVMEEINELHGNCEADSIYVMMDINDIEPTRLGNEIYDLQVEAVTMLNDLIDYAHGLCEPKLFN